MEILYLFFIHGFILKKGRKKAWKLLVNNSLVQDYFLETLEERDYFEREATFYGLIRDIF